MKFLVSQSHARLQVLQVSVRCWATPDFGVRCRQGQLTLLFSKTVQLVLGSSQPLTPKVMGLIPWGKAAGGVRQTSHLHLVPRLRMSGAVPLVLPIHFAYKKRQNFLDCNVRAAENISAFFTLKKQTQTHLQL